MRSMRLIVFLSSAAFLTLLACGSPAENDSGSDAPRPRGEEIGTSVDDAVDKPELASLIVALMKDDPEDAIYTKARARLLDFTCADWKQFEASILDEQLEEAGVAWSVVATVEELVERNETCPAQALLLARLMGKRYTDPVSVSRLLIKYGTDVVPELGRLYKAYDAVDRDTNSVSYYELHVVLARVPATDDAVREVSRVLPSLRGDGRRAGVSWLSAAHAKGNALATPAMRTLLSSGTAEQRRAYLLLLDTPSLLPGSWMELVAERGQSDPDEGLRTLAQEIYARWDR
jgi:hypothetical protein